MSHQASDREISVTIEDRIADVARLPHAGARRLGELLTALVASVRAQLPGPWSTQLRVQVALVLQSTLSRLLERPDEDPFAELERVLTAQVAFLDRVTDAQGELMPPRASPSPETGDLAQATSTLFQTAWTVYSRSTYEHSVSLIHTRLLANGFDESFFRGKRCFDGGCGTGRFAVAMAQLGAASVVAMDAAEGCITFGREMAKSLGLESISFVQGDVTDLRQYESGSFDFVVSNGVLHHTVAMERGILEHCRITTTGGLVWLYLYGDGGIYWPIYDILRGLLAGIAPAEARRILLDLGIREGATYTFLDNVLAPIREYTTTSRVTQKLEDEGFAFRHENLRGTRPLDDTALLLATRHGPALMGPEGEVRIRIEVSGRRS